MHKIITITVNPALDKSTSAKNIVSDDKIRCASPVYEPGGGGINVSRAIKKLGGESCAWFLAGGPPGVKLQELLKEEEVDFWAVETRNWSRENLMVVDEAIGKQYRFGMPGSETYEEEWMQIINRLEKLEEVPEYVIASGSLPPGVPDDFYYQLAVIANKRNFKLIVDTSGAALLKAASESIFLLKPNQAELPALAEQDKVHPLAMEDVAMKVLEEGKCQVLVVSLGPRGAMLATKEKGISYVVPPSVKQGSAVGAGDSMVAGMVLGLQRGYDMEDVVRYGVAAGSAATITPGSELCRKADTEAIYQWLQQHK
ncbi:1-phosphofructokinase family hexose kinase [Pontibacter silvestris]|uniref:1-phosphofructokinase family hexose kinase n=1 Tax=Pontibacter silvestris TaxID=2305183 RepID=A0ABW4WUX6_9BACT|nr:hexose kinase [Pontibacter silvestris]MCC9138010.1 hexose kinase [Pontibacter silvestris]